MGILNRASSGKKPFKSESSALVNRLSEDNDIDAFTELPAGAAAQGMSGYDALVFDMMPEAERLAIMNKLQPDRPQDLPTTITDDLFFYGYRVRVNALSNKRGSRAEYLRALGGNQQTEAAKQQGRLRWLFGEGAGGLFGDSQ
ncbi:MAG: hypothetical protein OK452_04270 [Thaumarchaeota archaeon]|nr:hypothetical protein [Nitrososphaerota archaeon]